MAKSPDDEYMEELEAEITSLKAQLAECKKDQARYRWLRDNSINQYDNPIVVSQSKRPKGVLYIGPLFGKILDGEIDAAMARKD
jgi:hypothetical protein